MKVLIVGAGKLGYRLAASLAQADDADVTVVDRRADVLEQITDHLDVLTVRANGVHVSALEDLDVSDYDLAVACTGSDETNIICSSIIKRMGCKRVAARIRDMEYVAHRDFIQKLMDIDMAVNPEWLTARAICGYLMKSYSFNSSDYARGRASIFDIPAKSVGGWIGKALKDIPQLASFVLVAINRDGELVVPYGNTVIMEDDTLYLMGKTEELEAMVKTMQKKVYRTPKRVMILGGGRVGYQLAKRLSDQGVRVKVVEIDEDKCALLEEHLGNSVLVLHGDGTDTKLLEDEELDTVDALVGATGYDEENLLMALAAKRMGVRKAVAKVSRNNYTAIIESLGVDAVFSSTDITASSLLKYARGGKMLTVSLMLGGKAEVNEIIADDSMVIVNRPLKDLGLPPGIIIGAVLKGNELIIANGDTVISPGDRFVAFCLASMMPKFRKFIAGKVWGH